MSDEVRSFLQEGVKLIGSLPYIGMVAQKLDTRFNGDWRSKLFYGVITSVMAGAILSLPTMAWTVYELKSSVNMVEKKLNSLEEQHQKQYRHSRRLIMETREELFRMKGYNRGKAEARKKAE